MGDGILEKGCGGVDEWRNWEVLAAADGGGNGQRRVAIRARNEDQWEVRSSVINRRRTRESDRRNLMFTVKKIPLHIFGGLPNFLSTDLEEPKENFDD